MAEGEYCNAEVVKFRLRFRGANSTPHNKIGVPVYDGTVSEEMIGPGDFFPKFIADVHSAPGSSVTSLPSIFSNPSSMDILRTLYRKYFRHDVSNLLHFRYFF
jgi:hypothetical protein